MSALKDNVNLKTTHKECEKIQRPEEGEVVVGLLESLLKDPEFLYYSLSAPEANVMKQVAIIRHPELSIDLVNPVIISCEDKFLSFAELCVSFPLKKFNCLRWKEIEIENGFDRKRIKLSNVAAALVQHEIDHLNGILPLDRTIRFAVVREDGMIRDNGYCVCGNKERFLLCCKKKK